jgi:spore coat protein A
MPVSRRELLKRGLMAAPGLSLAARLTEAQSNDPGSPPVFPFTRPLRIPPVLNPGGGPPGQDSYTITMQEALADIFPGRPTPVWTYNGIYPGPTIRAIANRQVNVLQVNNLSQGVSVHLHGGHAPASSDGHPTDLIAPGMQKTYTYPNLQLPAPLWYHDHAVDLTGPHVYMGLAGFYLMTDTTEVNLNLPTGNNDVPLLFQDRLFNKNGTLFYPLTDDARVRGVLGDRMLVNGVIQPFFPVARRKWRFRLLNGSNARFYDFALSNGQPFIQIGSDGGLLSAPVNRTVIRLGPAERADVVIDFTNVPTGTQVFLRNLNRIIPTSLDRPARDIMRFDVGNVASDSSQVPATLRTFTPPGAEVATRDFTLTQGLQNGRPVWFINGLLFDENHIEFTVTRNTVELWRIVNSSTVTHSMHVHLVQFQVLDVVGVPPLPGDDHWKDTVNIPPGAIARVKARFADYPGTFVLNCSALERQDHAMMTQFAVS